MGIVVNLDVMMAKRKMSLGELAQKVDITMANLSILKNNKARAVRFSTLEAICRGFGITLSQFFAEGEMLEMTPEVSELVSQWITLTPDQKRVILDMAKALNNKTE